jgi:hypothetical protein
MSSGKDNKIICWNPNDLSVMAEIVYEIPCNHWCFDVKWCLGMIIILNKNFSFLLLLFLKFS